MHQRISWKNFLPWDKTHINRVLLEIRDQFLSAWFPCMAFSLRNQFWNVSRFIFHEENIQEFLFRGKYLEARRDE